MFGAAPHRLDLWVLAEGVCVTPLMGEGSVARPAAKRSASPARKDNAVVRYFKEVRAEVRRVTWPSRRVATRLSIIVMAVTILGSLGMGVVDWLFTKFFALIIG